MASDAAVLPSTFSTTPRLRVENAVSALLKWKESQSKNHKPQLLPQDDFVYLNLSLKKIPHKPHPKPFKIPIPHTLLDSSSELCLIIDDRPKSNLTKDMAKKIIKSQDITISKVLSLSKLKTNYKPYEAKRKLCDSFDLFFADRRIVPMLPKLLGKHFFGKKKLPLPLDLTHKNWKEQIGKACSSTFLSMKTGTCSVVKVGKVSMEIDQIVENVVAAINGIVEVVPRKRAGVRSLHLKLSDSLALPIYQALPDFKMKIQGARESEEGTQKEDAGELVMLKDESCKSEELRKKPKKKKGRIHEVRYMDAYVGEEELANGNEDGDYQIEKSKNEIVDKKTEADLVQGQAESESEKGESDEMDTSELDSGRKGLKKRKKVLSFSNGKDGTQREKRVGKVEKENSKKQRKAKLPLKDGQGFAKKNRGNGDRGTKSIDGKTKTHKKSKTK